MYIKHLFKQYPPKSKACFIDGEKLPGEFYVLCDNMEQWANGKNAKHEQDSTFTQSLDIWIFFQ